MRSSPSPGPLGLNLPLGSLSSILKGIFLYTNHITRLLRFDILSSNKPAATDDAFWLSLLFPGALLVIFWYSVPFLVGIRMTLSKHQD
jgi:hypothetical protein